MRPGRRAADGAAPYAANASSVMPFTPAQRARRQATTLLKRRAPLSITDA
jgi:hypothetical protein